MFFFSLLWSLRFYKLGEIAGNFGTVIFHGGDEIYETASASLVSRVKEPSPAPGIFESPSDTTMGEKSNESRYFIVFVNRVYVLFLQFSSDFANVLIWHNSGAECYLTQV